MPAALTQGKLLPQKRAAGIMCADLELASQTQSMCQAAAMKSVATRASASLCLAVSSRISHIMPAARTQGTLQLQETAAGRKPLDLELASHTQRLLPRCWR